MNNNIFINESSLYLSIPINDYMIIDETPASIKNPKKKSLESKEDIESSKKQRANPYFTDIYPDELFIKIFQHLESLEIGLLGNVSKKFHEISQDSSLWDFKKLIFLEDFPNLESSPKSNYKNIYKELYLKQLVLKSFDNHRCQELAAKYKLKPSPHLSSLFKGVREAFIGSNIESKLESLGIFKEEANHQNLTLRIFSHITKAWASYENFEPYELILETLLKPLNRLSGSAVQQYLIFKNQTMINYRRNLAEVCDYLIRYKNIESIAIKLKTLKNLNNQTIIYNENQRVTPLFDENDSLESFELELKNENYSYERLETYLNAFILMNQTLKIITFSPIINSQSLELIKKEIIIARNFIEQHKISY